MPCPGQKILIVDDEKVFAETLAQIFQKEGYDCRAVYSAEQAVGDDCGLGTARAHDRGCHAARHERYRFCDFAEAESSFHRDHDDFLANLPLPALWKPLRKEAIYSRFSPNHFQYPICFLECFQKFWPTSLFSSPQDATAPNLLN